MAIKQHQLTLEEFLRLPEEKPALEFHEECVSQKVSPKGKHSRLQWAIAQAFNQFGEARHLAVAFPELRVTFGGRSYVPDVSVFRWERIPLDDNGQIANDFRDAPDVAVEIVSPEQSTNALVRRCLWYVEHGVRAALLVDAADQSVIVFPLDEPMHVCRDSDRLDLSNILPGLVLAAEDIFAALAFRPSTAESHE